MWGWPRLYCLDLEEMGQGRREMDCGLGAGWRSGSSLPVGGIRGEHLAFSLVDGWRKGTPSLRSIPRAPPQFPALLQLLSRPGFQLQSAPPPLRAVHRLLLLLADAEVCWRRLPASLCAGHS